MSRTALSTPPFLLLLALAGAGEAAPSDAEIDAAVRELGADAIESREAAFLRLLDWGLAFPDAVCPRLRPDDPADPEVGRRCADLRARIRRGAAWDAILRKAENAPAFAANLDAVLTAPSGPAAVSALEGLAAAARAQDRAAAAEAFRDACARLLVDRPGDAGLQAAALENLADAGDPRAAAAARKLAEDTSLNDASRREDEGWSAFSELRALALETLASLGDPSAGDIAIARLKDPRERPEVRDAALSALWNARDPRAEEVSAAHFGDPDPEIQYMALQFVRSRAARTPAAPLRKALEPLVKGAPGSLFGRGDCGILAYALLTDMLGDAGDPAAAPLLMESLDRLSAAVPPDRADAVADLRARTVAALGKLAGREEFKPASR